MFKFGIEHEVAFVDATGKFLDFSCATFTDFNQIIDTLPEYQNDRRCLHIGDAGIRKKRWYIEGFERFGESGEAVDCVPKGIEIRTTIHSGIESAIAELNQSYNLLCQTAENFGFTPVAVSFNPYRTVYEPQPPLNKYELSELQAAPEEQTVNIYMVTYGPDLNISVTDLPTTAVIDIGQKFTYYSPYIIPFSYSSPFYDGALWDGLSVRTFIRNGKRPATRVFVQNSAELVSSYPSLTKIARIPAEIGRIEFKAFDTCSDFSLYAGLLTLLKGLILDQTLLERATTPDVSLFRLSARAGFENEKIYAIAAHILDMVEVALGDDPDVSLLKPLKNLLEKRETPAHQMIREFKRVNSIEKTLRKYTENG